MCPACARDANAAEIPMKDRQVETCMGVAFAEKRRSPEILKNSGAIWSGTPGSNRRPSPWQGEQTESPAVSAPHQPSPSEPNHSGSLAATEAPITNDPQPCTTVVFHWCSKTEHGRSTSPKQRCCSVVRRTPSALPAGEESWHAPETI